MQPQNLLISQQAVQVHQAVDQNATYNGVETFAAIDDNDIERLLEDIDPGVSQESGNDFDQMLQEACEHAPILDELESTLENVSATFRYHEADASNSNQVMKRKAVDFEAADPRELFEGGWLANLVENTSLEVVGYLQVLDTKRVTLTGGNAIVVKANDGKYVTWNVVIDPAKEDDLLNLPLKSIIKVLLFLFFSF